jgi:hypothetical protein
LNLHPVRLFKNHFADFFCADQGTHAGSHDQLESDPLPLQDFEHPNMSQTQGSAPSEGQSDFYFASLFPPSSHLRTLFPTLSLGIRQTAGSLAKKNKPIWERNGFLKNLSASPFWLSITATPLLINHSLQDL